MPESKNKKNKREAKKEQAGLGVTEIDEMINKAEGSNGEIKEKESENIEAEKGFEFSTLHYILIGALAILLVYTQIQVSSLGNSGGFSFGNADITQIKSTAQAVAVLFPVDKIKTTDDAIAMMIPTGTPEYSDDLGGISFDDPVNSMTYLAKWYSSLKEEVKQDAGLWQRYINLAAAPRGISCEFCCGVGPQGIDSKGNLRCGCQHAPALQALTLGLMKYTDYDDTRILYEVMRWKALFFPKNMVEIAMKVAGSGGNVAELPGMIGGC